MDVKIAIRQLRLSYGNKAVLKGIDLDIVKNHIYGFMGPSASGKSTLISVINKMVSFENGVAISGHVYLDGEDIIDGDIDEVSSRKRIERFSPHPSLCPARYTKMWRSARG